MLRIGLAHYNTAEEIDRLPAACASHSLSLPIIFRIRMSLDRRDLRMLVETYLTRCADDRIMKALTVSAFIIRFLSLDLQTVIGRESLSSKSRHIRRMESAHAPIENAAEIACYHR